jgi:hypothetical protein
MTRPPTDSEDARRSWIIRWLYAIVLAHLLGGLLLPWLAGLPLLDAYHRAIENSFWHAPAPAAARDQQVWWISLFSPTLEAAAVWMGALVHAGARTRDASVWAWLIAGLAVWAPQDIALSLRAAAWMHVWIDSAAVLTMLPPLAWLWKHDRQAAEKTRATVG